MKNKKTLKALLISITMFIIILVLCIVVNSMFGAKKELFVHSHENHSWGEVNYGFIIYSDGTIEEYDNVNDNKELQKNKLTKNELNQLKELANKVQEHLEFDNSMVISDAGITIDKIYNEQLDKWVILEKDEETRGSNNSEESIKIKELVKKLCEKYIGTDSIY